MFLTREVPLYTFDGQRSHQLSRSDQSGQSHISDPSRQTPPKGLAVKVNLESEIGGFGLVVRVRGILSLYLSLAGVPRHTVECRSV